MHKMGVHTAYFISQCSDAPEHSYRLARAFTALAHTLNGRSYGIFFQPVLRRVLACVCSLTRAFTALAHTQNERTYGIFFQSMLRRVLACVKSCQSLHCSCTCTKWAYIWHISAVNTQTRHSFVFYFFL